MPKHAKKGKSTSLEVVTTTETTALQNLNPDEKHALKKCEAVIRRGWDTFIEVGKALATIQKDRLYRERYKTFEAYCRDRWQYGKSHAHRLIGAAEVVGHLSPIGDEIPLPLNESQVRPLIGLSPEDQVKAWKAAVGEAGGKGVTATLVRRAAESFTASKPTGSRKRLQQSVPIMSTVLEAVESALSAIGENNLDRAQSTLQKLRTLLNEAKTTS